MSPARTEAMSYMGFAMVSHPVSLAPSTTLHKSPKFNAGLGWHGVDGARVCRMVSDPQGLTPLEPIVHD
jgi:hypothetical protein